VLTHTDRNRAVVRDFRALATLSRGGALAALYSQRKIG
jgi:hypothetical protein